MQKLVHTFIDPVFCSFGLHTDKQISVTQRRLVSGQHVFHNL